MVNNKLETLQKQRERLRARIAEEEGKLKSKTRKEDTRLKILVGAAFLNDARTPSGNTGVGIGDFRAWRHDRQRPGIPQGKGLASLRFGLSRVFVRVCRYGRGRMDCQMHGQGCKRAPESQKSDDNQ